MLRAIGRNAATSSLVGVVGAALVALVLGANETACSDVPTPVPCTDVPAGGCPSGGGVACDDPTCDAVYTCANGAWSFDHTCPSREGGAFDAGDGDAGDAGGPTLRDAGFDVPPGASGGPGCPDLQPPDCPLGTALACPSNSCCGCEDLFVCQGGIWSPWGLCGDGGAITQR